MPKLTMLIISIFFLLIADTPLFALPAKPGTFAAPNSVSSNLLAPGLAAYQYTYNQLYDGPQVISIIAMDLKNSNLELGIGVCPNRTRASISTLAKANNALAAANFGYFNMADPSSSAGTLKYNNIVDATGAVGNGSGGFVSFTGNRVNFSTPDNFDISLSENARAGFPLLVLDSNIYSKIGSYDHVLGRHNRTAIGITPGNIFFIVAVDGRATGRATGMTCPQLADFMQRLGCSYAMNMDGGGSTAMWTRPDGIISYPSDNRAFDHAGERKVYDIIYIREKIK